MIKLSDKVRVYGNVNQKKPERSFNMTSMEIIYEEASGKTNEPHRHDFFTILWVKKATGIHVIDFTEYALGTNQIFFVSPGQIHQVNAYNRPSGAVITFSPDFLVFANISERFIQNINLFEPYSESPPLTPDSKTTQKLERICEDIDECIKNPSAFHDQALGALLKLFLIHCNRLCLNELAHVSDEQRTHLVSSFKELVERHRHEKHKVREYAELLHITPKHLNEVVKNAVGYTAKEYIQDRIITEAKRMLIHSGKSVKAIGYFLGFSEPIHFSSFFKNCTGMSPSAFKSVQAKK
jgi:AraC-like DNA-binding protein/mannose-6-phosphate isomerase-like protein (cupin superfamily)